MQFIVRVAAYVPLAVTACLVIFFKQVLAFMHRFSAVHNVIVCLQVNRNHHKILVDFFCVTFSVFIPCGVKLGVSVQGLWSSFRVTPLPPNCRDSFLELLVMVP